MQHTLPFLLLLSTLTPVLGAQRGGGATPPANPTITFQNGGSLYVMNADGSNVRTVLSGASAVAAMEPAWSPDATEIAFVGAPGGQAHGIWAVRPDGTGLRQVAVLPAGFGADLAWSPAPAPDGRTKVAYVVPSNPSVTPYNYEVFLANADGSGATQLTMTVDHEMDVAWSPDGSRLAVTALAMQDGGKPYCAVLSLGVDGHQQVVVTGTIEVTRLAGSPLAATDGLNWTVRDPDWARSGERLLLSVRKPGFGDDLWIVDFANPLAPMRLNPNGGIEYFGTWSPDDSRICYRRNGTSKERGLYTMAANGTGAVKIASAGYYPDWRRTP